MLGAVIRTLTMLWLCSACGAGPEPAPVPRADPSDEPSPSPAPVAEPTLAPEGFTWTATELPEDLRSAMFGTSWREGCPTPMADLRLLSVRHRDFDGGVGEGRLVVHRDAVESVRRAFEAAFDEGFPIRSVVPVSAFDGSDDASMAADNTSAFNCRPIKGTMAWSEHATGMAIDVNPRENPWVRGEKVDPPEGRAFLERDGAVPGVLTEDSAMVLSFRESGWGWGGRWSSRKDYQHFSASGR